MHMAHQDMSRIAPLTVSTAIARAVQAEVRCTVVQWLAVEGRQLRLTLATSDPVPVLSLATDGKSEWWLDRREESAPDQWDYHAELTGCRAVSALRVGVTPHSTDVPFLSAEFALVAEYGWGDHLERPAEALVDGAAFERALEEQLQSCEDR